MDFILLDNALRHQLLTSQTYERDAKLQGADGITCVSSGLTLSTYLRTVGRGESYINVDHTLFY
jgi:hypothetical protein